MERTISFMNGEGSIGHNTRRFIADNVDASRTKNCEWHNKNTHFWRRKFPTLLCRF